MLLKIFHRFAASRLRRGSIQRNVATVVLFDAAAKAFTLVATILLIRCLGRDDYAVWTFFLSAAMVFAGILSSGATLSYVAYESHRHSIRKSRPDQPDIFWHVILLNIISHLVVASVGLPFTATLGSVFSKVEPESGFGFVLGLALLYSLVRSCAELFFGRLQSHDRYWESGALRVAGRATVLGLLLGLQHFRHVSFATAATIYVIADLLTFLPICAWIARTGGLFAPSCYHALFSVLHEYGWLVIYFGLLQVMGNFNVFVISHFLNKPDLAQFGVAMQYRIILLSALPAIQVVLRVRMFKADMIGNAQRHLWFMRRWLTSGAKLVIPALVLAAVLVPLLMPTLNGPGYDKAIPVFRIFCVGVAFSYLFSPMMNVLRVQRRFRLMAVLTFVVLCLNVAGSLAVIGPFGMCGVAWVTSISPAATNVAAAVCAYRRATSQTSQYGGQ